MKLEILHKIIVFSLVVSCFAFCNSQKTKSDYCSGDFSLHSSQVAEKSDKGENLYTQPLESSIERVSETITIVMTIQGKIQEVMTFWIDSTTCKDENPIEFHSHQIRKMFSVDNSSSNKVEKIKTTIEVDLIKNEMVIYGEKSSGKLVLILNN